MGAIAYRRGTNRANDSRGPPLNARRGQGACSAHGGLGHCSGESDSRALKPELFARHKASATPCGEPWSRATAMARWGVAVSRTPDKKKMPSGSAMPYHACPYRAHCPHVTVTPDIADACRRNMPSGPPANCQKSPCACVQNIQDGSSAIAWTRHATSRRKLGSWETPKH